MDTKKIVKAVAVAGLLVVLAMPVLSMAQPANPGGITSPIQNVAGVQSLLERILRIMYVIFFIIAAIFIVMAAFKYLTAGGEEEKVGEAKKMLIYAIVAIAVALIATGVASVVRGVLGGDSL